MGRERPRRGSADGVGRRPARGVVAAVEMGWGMDWTIWFQIKTGLILGKPVLKCSICCSMTFKSMPFDAMNCKSAVVNIFYKVLDSSYVKKELAI